MKDAQDADEKAAADEAAAKPVEEDDDEDDDEEETTPEPQEVTNKQFVISLPVLQMKESKCFLPFLDHLQKIQITQYIELQRNALSFLPVCSIHIVRVILS